MSEPGKIGRLIDSATKDIMSLMNAAITELIAERDALKEKAETAEASWKAVCLDAALAKSECHTLKQRAERAEAAMVAKDAALERVLQWCEQDSPNVDIDAEAIRKVLKNPGGVQTWKYLVTQAVEANLKLERAEAANAQMRKALQVVSSDFDGHAQCLAAYSDGEYTQNYTTRRELVNKALSTDAGRGWVPIEDVRPLLDWAVGLHAQETKARFLAKHGEKLKG